MGQAAKAADAFTRRTKISARCPRFWHRGAPAACDDFHVHGPGPFVDLADLAARMPVGLRRMKLNFDCRPFYEPSISAVKFVGYHQDSQGHDQFVLCRVSRDALEHLGGVTNANADQLMAIFHSVQAKVYAIATAQYAIGVKRPLVTKDDVQKQNGEKEEKPPGAQSVSR
jgi:hypothetical protein